MSCTTKKKQEAKHTQKDTRPSSQQGTGKQEESLDLIVGKSLARPGKQIENFNALLGSGKALED